MPVGAASRPASPVSGAPARPATGALATDTTPRKLIVGRDISLSGEITACDHLVVEGTVDATLREGQRIEITESGLFRGKVEISEADIAGRFEGEITVRGRLRVRSTGRIDGKIQYGELEVEAGGHLEGQVAGLGRARPAQQQQQVGGGNQSTLDVKP
jgi:cytoskeletal protein CcmA (bactofilin family)